MNDSTDSPLDPDKIMAEHQFSDYAGDPGCTACDDTWPCLPYRLAAENAALRAAIERAELRGYEATCEDLLTTPGPARRRDIPQWLVPVLSDMIDIRRAALALPEGEQ